MIERLIYPEWLDAGEDALDEKISELEIELRGNDKEFKRLFEEKHRIIKAFRPYAQFLMPMNQRR